MRQMFNIVEAKFSHPGTVYFPRNIRYRDKKKKSNVNEDIYGLFIQAFASGRSYIEYCDEWSLYCYSIHFGLILGAMNLKGILWDAYKVIT